MADLWYDIQFRSSSSSSSSSSVSFSVSSSSSSSSVSNSSTSISSSCTQQFYDVTAPEYWDVVDAVWIPSASKWSSGVMGNPQVNLTPSAGTLTNLARPQQIRFTLEMQPGYEGLDIDYLQIVYNNGVGGIDALNTGTITLSANPQTFTYSLAGIPSGSDWPISQVWWYDSADEFWVSNIEFWEDCGSSSSSSESSAAEGPPPS